MKIFLSFFFIFLFLVVNGQTSKVSRSETENWIQQKLNTYIGKYNIEILSSTPYHSVSISHKNINFSFSGDNMLISATSNRNDNGVIQNYNTSWTIPIYELSNKKFYKGGKLYFLCNYSAIINKMTNGTSYKMQSLSFDFNFYDEENLEDRLDKAFAHLKTFVKKPVNKEVF